MFERKERDRGGMEESIDNTKIASTTGKEEDNEIGNSNTEGPDRQNANDTNVEDTDEKDRTEAFETLNARVTTDTHKTPKKNGTLRKGLTKTTQDTLKKYNLANNPKKEDSSPILSFQKRKQRKNKRSKKREELSNNLI